MPSELFVPLLPLPWKNGGDNSRPPQVLYGLACVRILADMDADADGSPRAKEIDPSGSIMTSLSKDNGWKGPNHYVDSETIPYIVLPLNFGKVALGGLVPPLGCLCHVKFGDYGCFAIFADEGPENLIGEGSIALIEALGGNPWDEARAKIVRGIPYGVEYTVFPHIRDLTKCVGFNSIQDFGKSQTSLPVKIAKVPGTVVSQTWPSDGRIPFAKWLTAIKMRTHGPYQGGNASGVLLHHSAGKPGSGIMSYGASKGYAYLAIDRDGTIYQAHDIREWGYHAGTSAYKGLEGGVTDDLIGIEVITAGRLEVVNGKKYPWWAFDDDGKLVKPNEFIPDSECMFIEDVDGYPTAGWYQKTTTAQEEVLKKLVLWLLVRCRKAYCVSHYEVCQPRGRKNDLNGASFTMGEFRSWLRSQGVPATP